MEGALSPWVDTAPEGVPAPARPVGQGTRQDRLSGWQRRCCSVTPIELAGTQPSRTCWKVSSREPGKAVREQVCWRRCPATSQVPAAGTHELALERPSTPQTAHVGTSPRFRELGCWRGRTHCWNLSGGQSRTGEGGESLPPAMSFQRPLLTRTKPAGKGKYIKGPPFPLQIRQ